MREPARCSTISICGAGRNADRIDDALYERCREQVDRDASPTACVIDSQSVKSAEKGGPASIPRGMTRGRKSVARSGIFWSIPRA